MARPIKQGLDYFPIDTEMDDKIQVLEAEYGLEGFAILIKLFQQIYKNGYFWPWDERRQKLFCSRVNVDINRVSALIMTALTEGLFDRSMYEKYDILTSRGIQKRYFNAVKRRKLIEIKPEYLLIEVSAYINPGSLLINVNDNSINACRSTQRRGEKRRGNSPGINVDINSDQQSEEIDPDEEFPD